MYPRPCSLCALPASRGICEYYDDRTPCERPPCQSCYSSNTSGIWRLAPYNQNRSPSALDDGATPTVMTSALVTPTSRYNFGTCQEVYITTWITRFAGGKDRISRHLAQRAAEKERLPRIQPKPLPTC